DEELAQVKHHFIATKSIHDEYNAGMYAADLDEVLKELFKTKDVVIMTGGTGLYIKAAVEGLDVMPVRNEKLRAQLDFIYQSEGLTALQTIADKLEVNRLETDFENPQRLMRATEIAEGGKIEKVQKPKEKHYETEFYYVNRNRAELYERINHRVDLMLDAGFEAEARAVYPYKGINALQTVGYREFFKFFDGDYTREHAIEKMKQKTRNYAKRQLTWFRNQGDYTEVRPSLEELLIRLR
ncbi:tRNA (adenosine(37)-N6)-dimethylallyltransferase MiaA, partial [Bacteroidia bacterium]|nr:tRNA (adenosine(37)-N6)-dimethylallyltransferase MiaA [Bacteroidia bacterium]